MKNVLLVMGVSASLLVAACGGAEEPEVVAEEPTAAAETPTEAKSEVQEAIEYRQDRFKRVGANFKAVSDEIRSGSPDPAVVADAATKLRALSNQSADWFAEGTGPEAGFETEALPAIWENPEEFEAARERFQTAALTLSEAADAGDMEAAGAAFAGLGGSCKGCHDNFRLDD
ncbi:MAG: hypothetical protein CMK07_07775 [Ponticaulis sp.]|nr:hypothetical protein [Ponticaulis sp.]